MIIIDPVVAQIIDTTLQTRTLPLPFRPTGLGEHIASATASAGRTRTPASAAGWFWAGALCALAVIAALAAAAP